ncbi:hypothetical protein M413DRAFT_11867 [Hebeloma cylindrosporum]|uniref:Uncharacterized protein n=1 Tax=Hebeloma cylindrosporum TaxID=76867 RepID=A0A0C3C656_HEBCY|nr:hypothetical protein M413DRAFT_11867 [Hebeloma cylindrosporum h7]
MSIERSAVNYSLPVELLYELELYALSEHFPLVSHHFYHVFKLASPFFQAKYIIGRALDEGAAAPSSIYTKALRYPICNQLVLEAIRSILKTLGLVPDDLPIQLPRRLFRAPEPQTAEWSDDDHPLPLLRYLYHTPEIPTVNTNANDGYALTRAVHAKFTPLVRFLLEHRASPECHDSLAVKVAIRQKNIDMVKLLVERPNPKKGRIKAKRRKLEDRVVLDSSLLRIAVMSGAKDVVEYLYREKGVLPDMQTLTKMEF